MDSSKLVSVIIPVYNVAQYLQEALDSVIHQTYNNLEIIIIDDGSTDGSGKTCDEYAGRDPRIHVIHQENKGLSAARNAGLDIMTGDVVAFLDSDDAYYPGFIEAMIIAMNRANAEIVACKYTTIKTTGNMAAIRSGREKPSASEGTYERGDALRALAEYRLNHVVWNKIYCRELWGDIRFPDGHVYEDIAVTYQLFDKCRKVYFLEQPLYMYRKRPGSISSLESVKCITDYFLAFSKFEEFIRENMPEVFSAEHIKRFRQMILRFRIKKYILVSRNSKENKKVAERIRKEIIETGEKTGISECNRLIRICYQVIRQCPGVLIRIYSIYHYVHTRTQRQ